MALKMSMVDFRYGSRISECEYKLEFAVTYDMILVNTHFGKQFTSEYLERDHNCSQIDYRLIGSKNQRICKLRGCL